MANQLHDLDKQACVTFREGRADLDSSRLDRANLVREITIEWPKAAEVPARHTARAFYGAGTPVALTSTQWDAQEAAAKLINTNLPDAVAPIGSEYVQYSMTSGAVTGAKKWLKTAANTWTDLTA